MLSFFADSLVFAAEASEAETSKTLFYVMGGALAAWAVILFLVGMRSHTFAGSPGGQRGVIAISVLLVVATMASSIITA